MALGDQGICPRHSQRAATLNAQSYAPPAEAPWVQAPTLRLFGACGRRCEHDLRHLRFNRNRGWVRARPFYDPQRACPSGVGCVCGIASVSDPVALSIILGPPITLAVRDVEHFFQCDLAFPGHQHAFLAECEVACPAPKARSTTPHFCGGDAGAPPDHNSKVKRRQGCR